MQILDEETTVATKTKLNSDYVPGMVTVLQGSDLESMGIQTVWEALSLVPGVQTSRGSQGEPFATVRGLPFPFNSGNIKILVNSIAMSRETSAINTSALLTAVAQVERIEVIRGPGSSVYGNFAFLGLVNIITRKSDKGAFVATSGGDHRQAGARAAVSEGDLKFSANVTGWTSDRGDGPIDQVAAEDRVSAVLSLGIRESQLSYQIFDRNYSSSQTLDERNQALDLRHHQPLSDRFSADVEANYLLSDASTPGGAFKGSLSQGEVDLNLTTDRTKLLFAVSGTDANIDRAVLGPPGRPQDGVEIIDSGWQAWSVSTQGQFDVREKLTATVGIRYDSREDINARRTTPRLALVWRAGPSHVIKAQYAEGFRAATFFELFARTREGHMGACGILSLSVTN